MIPHTLRKKYANKKKLQDILLFMFPDGNYMVKITETHWMLYLPIKLSDAEVAEIERQIRVHYK